MVCNKAQQQAFQQELARVVFSGNLAFRSVRDPQMVKFLNHVAPKLKIPSPRMIGGRLLDEEHARQVAHLCHLVKDTYLSLSIDGWTGPQNEALVGACLGPHVVSLINEPGAHTAEFYATQMQAAVTKSQLVFGARVSSVVTDNASNMASARAMFLASRGSAEPLILAYGCQAHVLQLAVRDYLKTNEKILASITAVLVAFKNSHHLSQGLVQRKVPRPPLPGKTRWASNYLGLRCVSFSLLLLRPSGLGKFANRQLFYISISGFNYFPSGIPGNFQLFSGKFP